MSSVLFLSIPSHGHMNPMLGLAAALIRQGEKVVFFSSDEFKNAVEEIGASYRPYKQDLNLFRKRQEHSAENTKPAGSGLVSALLQPDKYIDDLLAAIEGLHFDYLVHSAAYPYATVIAQILHLPAVSSFAVFATLKELMPARQDLTDKGNGPMGMTPQIMDQFMAVRQQLIQKYQVSIPTDIFSLFFNKGDLNIIYTSRYFVPKPENYDDSYIFIGPPIYNKPYQASFPYEKLEGKKVIYISLGTIFGNHSARLNQLFFDSFGGTDAVVVMAAYKVDLTEYTVPDNFIVRDYVPQLELLKYATIAITHAGMNSIGDLLYNNVPFVSIPLGADQFYLANRAQELGATILFDHNTLTPELLKDAVAKVTTDPSYAENIRKISQSFKEAGGYDRAVKEIQQMLINLSGAPKIPNQ